MATERQALLVLGMHRSGTSALTRVLNLHGAHLPDDLLPANSGNEAGYWESSAVFRFNEQFLAAMGSRWDSPTWFSLPPLSEAAIQSGAETLAAVLTSEYGDAPLIVVKDPRISRLLPVWRAAFDRLGIRALPALMIRHPFEVAASLKHRDEMPEGLGLLLWLQYTLAAELATRGVPRVPVFYDQLLASPTTIVSQLQTTMGLTLPERGASVDAQVSEFLRPSLRHERASDNTATSLPEWVATTYAWLQQGTHGQLPGDTSAIDRVREELVAAETLFGAALTWHLHAERSRAEYAEANGKWWQEHAGNLEKALHQTGAARATAEAQLESETTRARALADRVTRLESQLTTTAAVDTALRLRINELRTRLTDLEAASARAMDQTAS